MKKKRRYAMETIKRGISLMTTVIMAAGLLTLTPVDTKATSISNPRIVEDSTMEAGQKVTWDCIYFGSYPQAEVVTSKMSENYVAMDKEMFTEGDLVVSDSLYDMLEEATGWDENNDIVLDGEKYRRIKKEDAIKRPFYIWSSSLIYHYFRYEPIKWRVLHKEGDNALLLADRVLDDQRYHLEDEAVTWETSTMRSWLNGYGAESNQNEVDYSSKNFLDSAFTVSEQNDIATTNVKNEDNLSYRIEGGNDTSDKVFLLSESQIYKTEEAAACGFAKDNLIYDEARMSKSSVYAKAMGALDSSINCNWWLRSPGEHAYWATYVQDNGWVNKYGCNVYDGNDHGVRPALNLDLSSSSQWSLAGTACSDGTSEIINLSQNKLKLKVRESAELAIIINGIESENSNIVWSSSDENVANVEKGVVTAVSAGTAIITASLDGEKYPKCEVTVEGPIVITKQPSGYRGNIGTVATFNVEAYGEELKYQWQYSRDNGNKWSNSSQSGSKTTTISVPITETRDGQQYRCVITDKNGNTMISEAVKLIVATGQEAEITNPRIVEDSTMRAGQKVTWDCIYFGQYPQAEVVTSEMSENYTAVRKRYLTKGDLVVSDNLYATLEKATGWDENNDISIGEKKYRRMKKTDATYAISGNSESYNWSDSSTYHYFQYEPIKWRVLYKEGDNALLLADRVLDDQRYHLDDEAVTWETSTMRSWLNGYNAENNQNNVDYSSKNFLDSAFTVSEQNDIVTKKLKNNDENIDDSGVGGGYNTKDKVFLLSETQVYDTETAASYGFIKNPETDDEAKKSMNSIYAKAMGTWSTTDSDYEEIPDNVNKCNWWLRSPGGSKNKSVYVYYYGQVTSTGVNVDYDRYGVRPALYLNLLSKWVYAGTVCSDGTSTESQVTVEEGVTIVTQPEDYMGIVGDTARFTVEATGKDLRYQWQFSNDDGANWKNSSQSGYKTESISVPITEARDGQQYRCIVTDGNGNSVTSEAGTLIATKEALEISSQPKNYTGAVGDTAVFTVEASGESLRYQWQYSNDEGATWKNSSQSGNKTATIKVPITEARNGQQYRCVVTDANGSNVTSEAAKLIVGTELTITSQPRDYTGAVGDTAVFTVEASGESLRYQWQFSNDDGANWRNSSQSGCKTATVSVPITAARNGQQYRCVVTDERGNSVTSEAGRLIVQ